MKVISETMGNATLPSESQTPFQRFSKEMSGTVRRRRISSKMKVARTAKDLPCVKLDSHYYWMWVTVEHDMI